ncbi:MAG: fused MFS/spermidine synthase [Pseudohongiellaceae bacterium]
MTYHAHQSLLRSVVTCVAFVSGFAIMSIELLGGRVLAPYFGSSVYVWGSIITVFMLSLSFGYLWGGRLSMRNPNPVSYALFFIVASLCCLPIILAADSIMERIFLAIEDPRYGSLLASIMLYFLPICVLGMVSPYSVRLLVLRESHSGRVAGHLYFVSTLGSALGTLATSFYFVLWFEVNTIMWGLVAALLLASAAVLATHFLSHEQNPEQLTVVETKVAEDRIAQPHPNERGTRRSA